MSAMGRERYYIGGLQYIPEESTVLWKYDGIIGTATLYRTEKGNYFKVEESEDGKKVPELLTEDRARELMDSYPVGIDLDNYDTIFGEPEKG